MIVGAATRMEEMSLLTSCDIGPRDDPKHTDRAARPVAGCRGGLVRRSRNASTGLGISGSASLRLSLARRYPSAASISINLRRSVAASLVASHTAWAFSSSRKSHP